MDSAQVLTFWFGQLDADGIANKAHAQKWWRKDPALDQEIARLFGPMWQALMAESEASAAREPTTSLARVIVLDQFTRNMFRGDPRAFSADARALAIAELAIAEGQDRALVGSQRGFLYMPFMHSERLADQDRCLQLFTQFRDESEGRLRAELDGSVRFAEQHRSIIVRFGRFPHRNQILGRASTPEEITFLEQPGSSF